MITLIAFYTKCSTLEKYRNIRVAVDNDTWDTFKLTVLRVTRKKNQVTPILRTIIKNYITEMETNNGKRTSITTTPAPTTTKLVTQGTATKPKESFVPTPAINRREESCIRTIKMFATMTTSEITLHYAIGQTFPDLYARIDELIDKAGCMIDEAGNVVGKPTTLA